MGNKKIKALGVGLLLLICLIGGFAYWHFEYQKPRSLFNNYIHAYNYGFDVCTPNQATQNTLAKGFALNFQQANSGNLKAQYELGLAYLFGVGVKEDKQKAAQIIKDLANKGLPDAEANYAAFLYSNHDTTTAQLWLKKAVKQGNAYAAFNLAMIYLSENSPAQTQQKAYNLLLLAAPKLGIAKYALAEAYEQGYGAKQSNTDAIKWYEAAFNDPTLPAPYKQSAATGLAMLYSTGNSINQRQAKYWSDIAQKLYTQKGCQNIN